MKSKFDSSAGEEIGGAATKLSGAHLDRQGGAQSVDVRIAVTNEYNPS